VVNNRKVSRRGPKSRATKDRNRIAGPWEPLTQCNVPEEMASANIVALFQNNRYTVYVKTNKSTEFMSPEGNPTQVVHLIMARNDKKKTEPPWDEKQRAKNEICGPTCEAVELFPSEMRRLDIPNHQTHLWVYEPTVTLPHGLIPKEMQATHHAKKAAASIPPEERNVFVVFKVDEAGEKCPAEVYVDEAEARAIYGERLDAEPDGDFAFKPCGLDTIPPPDFTPPEGAVGSTWTEAAREKHGRFVEVMITALAGPEMVDLMLDVEMAGLPVGAEKDEVEYEFSGDREHDEQKKAAEATEEEAAISLEAERDRLRAERKARG